MGQEQSQTYMTTLPAVDSGFYRPMQIPGLVADTDLYQDITSTRLQKSAFSAVWSKYQPISLCPSPRCGFFTVDDPIKHRIIIGYGANRFREPSNDVWILNTETYEWAQFPLQTFVEPRCGSTAVIYKDKLIIFGGFVNGTYLDDLHMIDLDSGEVKQICTSSCPSPRSTPVMAVYNDKLYMWGGFNGSYISDLSVLDLSSFEWTNYPQEVHGRTSCAFCAVGNYFYVYGCSKQGGIIVINMEENSVKLVPTFGNEPNSLTMAAQMVHIENFLFFFGGRVSDQSSQLYALDLTKMTWFTFPLQPDLETVSLQDGHVNKHGLFEIPSVDSFGAAYVKERREIIWFLGSNSVEPSPINALHMSSGISHLHLQDDLLSMFVE